MPLQVRGSLGQAGDLATETAALLSMEQVQDDDQFTPEASGGSHFVCGNSHFICGGSPYQRVWLTLHLYGNGPFLMEMGIVRELPCTADCATGNCRRCWRACRPRPGPSARKSWPSGATSGGLVCARSVRRCCRPPQGALCVQHVAHLVRCCCYPPQRLAFRHHCMCSL